MATRPEYYVGIDTHKYSHTVSVINYDTDKILTFSFENTPEHFESALGCILEVTENESLIFGLEDVKSVGFMFSEFLDERDYIVHHVNPALADYLRRSSPNYKKSDDYDAYCVARVLKDNHKELPIFKHKDEQELFSNIRLLTNLRNMLSNQKSINYRVLHQQLEKVYPGYEKYFCNLQTKSAQAFYKQFPSPRHLDGYTTDQLVQEMKQLTRIFRKSTAEKILMSIHANKAAHRSIYIEESIVTLIETIQRTTDEIISIESKLEVLIHETGLKLQTIPNISTATAGRLISEIGDINRFRNEKQLAKFCGIAPVSLGSGGKDRDFASKTGNRKLRSTFYFLAVGMISADIHSNAKQPQFRTFYEKKLKEGKSKSQALVCIMRQLVRIIFIMMRDKTEWRPLQSSN